MTMIGAPGAVLAVVFAPARRRPASAWRAILDMTTARLAEYAGGPGRTDVGELTCE